MSEQTVLARRDTEPEGSPLRSPGRERTVGREERAGAGGITGGPGEPLPNSVVCPDIAVEGVVGAEVEAPSRRLFRRSRVLRRKSSRTSSASASSSLPMGLKMIGAYFASGDDSTGTYGCLGIEITGKGSGSLGIVLDRGRWEDESAPEVRMDVPEEVEEPDVEDLRGSEEEDESGLVCVLCFTSTVEGAGA